MTGPIPVRVTRYKDPHCGRTHSSRRGAVDHMARCWRNPDNRGCLTCRHHEIDPGEPEVGLDGGEYCLANVDLSGSQDVPAGPIVHCEKWEQKP